MTLNPQKVSCSRVTLKANDATFTKYYYVQPLMHSTRDHNNMPSFRIAVPYKTTLFLPWDCH